MRKNDIPPTALTDGSRSLGVFPKLSGSIMTEIVARTNPHMLNLSEPTVVSLVILKLYKKSFQDLAWTGCTRDDT